MSAGEEAGARDVAELRDCLRIDRPQVRGHARRRDAENAADVRRPDVTGTQCPRAMRKAGAD